MRKLSIAALLAAGVASAAGAHPLDGLTAAEISRTTEILRAEGAADDKTLYPMIELIEPPKAEVLAWSEGDPVTRRVHVDFASPEGFRRAVVNLTEGTVESTEAAAGQPMILFAEFMTAMELALGHPDMQAALARRNLSPEDVFCLPLTAGNFMTETYEGTRLMKVPCYLNPAGSNFYAKPIEGLFATVDLAAGKALEVVDEGVIPAPELDWGYTQVEIEKSHGLRPESNPVTLAQPGGANYTLGDGTLEWDIWRMRLRTDKRPGLVVSNIDVKDGDRWRSVLYQAHLSEVFVPYMDPGQGWYWRTYMDSGEYGFGLFLTPLRAGVDCPEIATFLPAVINDDAGNPMEIPDAICIFERNIGDPAWRHFEVFAQSPDTFVPAEGRPETELVVRTASEVGNYDYLIDYRFKQDGQIYIKVGASGLDAVKGVAAKHMDDPTAKEDTKYGTLIAPNLVAPFHDHYFNFRLDFDIDQPENMFGVMEIEPLEMPEGSPRRSGWTVKHEMPKGELEARYKISTMDPKHFHLMNMDARTSLGHHPSYMLHHGSAAYGPYDFENDPPFKRNGYIEYSVWNTVHDPAQRYAGGSYALQSDGSDSLSEWVKADRPLQHQDIVTWFTAGFHHIPRAEDWPVMSTEWKTVHMQPFNFFDHNPALTIRAPAEK